MRSRLFAIAFVGAFSAGCAVGPNYKRPAVSIPASYRGAEASAPNASVPTGISSFGNLKWWTVFHDPVLQNLIHTALTQNYDLRIAAARVVQARGELGVTRSQEFPEVNGTGSAARQKVLSPSIPSLDYSSQQLGGNISWLLDFWGKYRRATEAARANLLASEYNQQAVEVTLVSEVASAYFQLRALDSQLIISEDTLKSRQASFRLTRIKQQGGVASMLDVRQAQSLVQTAETTITDTSRLLAQQEDAISILLGEDPTAIPRGKPLDEETLAPTLPPGLPSSLLERRPDIRQAEQALIAANAQIGVARAEFFPQISLTGAGGTESFQLSQLFSKGIWSFAADLTQPIFTAGRLKGNLQAVRAEDTQTLLAYQQTIQEAFREISDALIGYQHDRRLLAQQQALTQTLADADRLARIQYQGGVTAYLNVLEQETQYFSGQLQLVQARLNQMDSVVELYRALGGGWQP